MAIVGWANEQALGVRILILGGTTEARELAERLVGLGHEVINSLAGRTADPIRPKGGIRVGKFGGIPGLAAYLRATRIEALVDATHPYAGLISINAVAASQQTGVPLVRLMRPAWSKPEAARWIHLTDAEHAAAALPTGAKAFVTIGSSELAPFAQRRDCSILARMIELPLAALPDHIEVLQARPPFTLDGEIRLMRAREITHLVTKNSGGWQTEAKLKAAEALGISVVMIVRPQLPPADEAATVEEAVALLGLTPRELA